MTLRLAEHWLWDFWFARDGEDVHVFYLQAPRSLRDPDLRHHHATIGHAVSRDLRSWTVLGDALGPGLAGAFDDLATWTGSVLCHAGRWHLFYTGIARADSGGVQRIGVATSDDLLAWEKHGPVVEADPRWYETSLAGAREEHWRDPWVVWDQDSGCFHMLVTARANQGARDGRGVIGHARSADLRSWDVEPPLSEPGELFQLEVPQLLELGGAWRILFCAGRRDHSAARLARPGVVAEYGIHYLTSNTRFGGYALQPGAFLVGDPAGRLYGGRILEHEGAPLFFAWRMHDERGAFVGELSDPMPVTVRADGSLAVEVRG
jgi:beta-fructofuranosidase